MIHYKSEREIELQRKAADLVGRTLGEVARHIKPGVKTATLDRIAEEFIRTNNAEPAFKGHRHGDNVFPATLCVSVNDAVVHGIPGDYRLKDGDLLSIDCGVILNGFVGDSAYTFPVGTLEPEDKELCRVTFEGLMRGIEQAIAGNRIGDIGHAVEGACKGYGIVKELCGHGVGRTLWEDPQIPNYGSPGSGRKLRESLTICIEPMINRGSGKITTDADGWTVRTADGSNSAHYEHMVVVRDKNPEILSTFDFIEDVIDAPYQLSTTHG